MGGIGSTNAASLCLYSTDNNYERQITISSKREKEKIITKFVMSSIRVNDQGLGKGY